MSAFVDTSALYALLDEDEARHESAAAAFRSLRGERLVTHAYVVVETAALVARRLGVGATSQLFDAILPAVEVEAVDAALHREAVTAYRASGSGSVSLVDRTSFEFMRRHALTVAFAFDEDFRAAGFDLVRPTSARAPEDAVDTQPSEP